MPKSSNRSIWRRNSGRWRLPSHANTEPPMPDRSAAQLERILYILPVAARQDGVLLVELARALGADPKSVLIDLEQAMTRAFYHPAAWVEDFTISIEHDRVSVYAPKEFQRPVRLNEQ